MKINVALSLAALGIAFFGRTETARPGGDALDVSQQVAGAPSPDGLALVCVGFVLVAYLWNRIVAGGRLGGARPARRAEQTCAS